MTLSLVQAAATGQRVYVAFDGAAHVKIGTSINTARRGGELRLQMVLSIPGTELEERRVHKMFATERVAKNQEWFWPSDRLVAWLHALIDSGDARIECDDAESAHHLVSLMYHQRWQIAA